jgi:hypothetical protein
MVGTVGDVVRGGGGWRPLVVTGDGAGRGQVINTVEVLAVGR